MAHNPPSRASKRQGQHMSADKKQPVKRYYALAAVLMAIGVAKFPWGQGAAMDQNALAVSVAFIAVAVGCAIRGRRNKREAQ